jgi:hypothetical protein
MQEALATDVRSIHWREEALREYYFLEDLIDRYDERSLKIKSWSITASGVALGFGLMENRPGLFLLAALGSLVFWYLEALWKVSQSVCILRAAELEKSLALPESSYDGPKIAETFRASFKAKIRKDKVTQIMWYPNVWMPHFLILAFGLILFAGRLLSNYGIVKLPF